MIMVSQIIQSRTSGQCLYQFSSKMQGILNLCNQLIHPCFLEEQGQYDKNYFFFDMILYYIAKDIICYIVRLIACHDMF